MFSLVRYTFETQLTPTEISRRLQSVTEQPGMFPFWLFTSQVTKPFIGKVTPVLFNLKHIQDKKEPLLCVKGKIETATTGSIVNAELYFTPFTLFAITASVALFISISIAGVKTNEKVLTIAGMLFTMFTLFVAAIFYRAERAAWHSRLKQILYAGKSVY